jgi:hypothetical protein
MGRNCFAKRRNGKPNLALDDGASGKGWAVAQPDRICWWSALSPTRWFVLVVDGTVGGANRILSDT